MARVPIEIQIGLRSPQRGGYSARVVGWGITDQGSYGSVWSLGIDLGDVPSSAPARDLLRALAVALLARVGQPE